MMFLGAVNRVLRQNAIITGDDDDITSFADLQHRASVSLCQIAIQSTITELSSDKCLPVEEADATITMVDGTRTYNLAGDFIRFVGENPFFLELDGSGNSANKFMLMYPGGEDQLRRNVLDYREQPGRPNYFYNLNAATKSIGTFQVPDSTYDGISFRYTYEKSIYPVAEGDTLPFVTDQESHTFVEMAARRFQFMFTKQPMDKLQQDIIYGTARASLMNLLNQTEPTSQYGYRYT